jgi:hypothetical protein
MIDPAGARVGSNQPISQLSHCQWHGGSINEWAGEGKDASKGVLAPQGQPKKAQRFNAGQTEIMVLGKKADRQSLIPIT